MGVIANHMVFLFLIQFTSDHCQLHLINSPIIQIEAIMVGHLVNLI
jgi:hypothetical protein